MRQAHQRQRHYRTSVGGGGLIDLLIVEPWLPGVVAEVGEIDGSWYVTIPSTLGLLDAADVVDHCGRIVAGLIELPAEVWRVEVDGDRLRRYTEIRCEGRGGLMLGANDSQ